MQKRGQLTIFIVVGILLVALLGVILYFRQDIIEQEPPEVIPEYLYPVRQYVESCLESTTEDAVILLGRQGGYIYMPDRILYDPTASIPSGGVVVPYWYYQGNSRVPTLDGMQEEINKYVEDSIDRCIGGFLSLNQTFEVSIGGNKTVKSQIDDEVISVHMKYPINARVRGQTSEDKITQYNSELKIQLKKIYELATEIMDAENNQMYLEEVTVDLMAAGKDIPFTDVLFECRQRTWYLPEVEQRIKDLLYHNLPKIRVLGTDTQPFLEHYSKYELLRGYQPDDIGEGNIPDDTPEDAYDYFHFRWPATVNDYSELRANVYYEKEWPFDITARPSSGSILKSSWGKGSTQYWLSFLCINAYHFTYDVIFPVEIIINDDSALRGNGYSFKFATPVLINHNQGDRSNFPITLYHSPGSGSGAYCDDRVDKNIAIYAKNKKNMDTLPDIDITFNCMNVLYCDLGTTDFEGGVNRLSTRLPSFCAPGELEAHSDKYTLATKTVAADASYADLVVTPLRTMTFEVLKKRFTAGAFQEPEPLEENETAVIYLTTNQLEDYDIFRRYPFMDAGEEFEKIKIPDDDLTYRLEIILMSKHNKIMGGYRGNWTINADELADKSKLTFYALEEIPHPQTAEEQAEVVMLLENGAYNNLIRPKFK